MTSHISPQNSTVPIGNISHHALILGSSIPAAEISDVELGKIIFKRFFGANPLRIYFARPQLPRERSPLYTRVGVVVAKRDFTQFVFDHVWIDKADPAAFVADCGEEIARALFETAFERDGFEAIVLVPDVTPSRRRVGGWK